MSDAPESIWAFYAPEIADDNNGATIVAHEAVQHGAQPYRRADLPHPQDAARIAELEAALRRAHILLAANLGFVKGSAEAAIEELGGFAEAMALAGDFVAADSGAAQVKEGRDG